MNAHATAVGELVAGKSVRLVDDYGVTHELLDAGGDELMGSLDFAGEPMAYWIPRSVAETWRNAEGA